MTGSTSVQVVSQVVVLVNGLPLGVLGDLLPGGTVSLDTTSANMRTCSFQCLDTNGVLMPGSSGHGLFDPTGIEVMIEKGFMVDGVPTLWSQGIFGVTECDVAVGSGGSVSPGPVLTISGTDRSLRLSLNLFTDSFTTTQGFTAVQSIYQILSSRAPWVQTNISPSTAMIAQQTFTPGSDPWVAILGIAQSAGMVCYFDVDGILVVRPTPSAAGSPTVVAIQDGPDQLASSLTAAYSNSPGYNGVIVIGTNPDTNQPVSGSAYDMDPTSRTFAGGAYGYRPAQPSHSSAPSARAHGLGSDGRPTDPVHRRLLLGLRGERANASDRDIHPAECDDRDGLHHARQHDRGPLGDADHQLDLQPWGVDGRPRQCPPPPLGRVHLLPEGLRLRRVGEGTRWPARVRRPPER